MSTELMSLRVRFEHDVVIARQRAREAGDLLGLGKQGQTRLATVVSELVRRAYRAGAHGSVGYTVEESDGHRVLAVRVQHTVADEDGGGVRPLEEVLAGARRLLDVVEHSEADGVTTVVVGQRLPGDAPRPGAEGMERIVEGLRDRNPNNPFEELQQQNEELVQAMAALREQERERSRLLEAERKAREEAQRAVKSREEILSIVSHDLRNPIGAIQTGARFLLEEPGLLGQDGIGRRQLRAIVRSAERANRLIQDLLDLSSIDQGTLSVDPEPVEPEAILADLRELMGGRVTDEGIRLELCAVGDVPPLCADRDRLVQALANLVSNAIRFTPEDGVITVDVTVVEGEEGDAVRFSVSDTGPGVAEADQDRLFDQFWTNGGGSGGAGLGLAIVRGIVRSHGGRAWYDPDAAPGACFHLTVPVVGPDCGSASGPGGEGHGDAPTTG